MTKPTTEDLLNSLGLTRLDPDPMPVWAVPAMAFGIGVAAGAAGALLFAPKSGRELRGDIADQANQIGTAVADALPINTESKSYSLTGQQTIEAK